METEFPSFFLHPRLTFCPFSRRENSRTTVATTLRMSPVGMFQDTHNSLHAVGRADQCFVRDAAKMIRG